MFADQRLGYGCQHTPDELAVAALERDHLDDRRVRVARLDSGACEPSA
jgi:hypothetical protein